MKSLGASASTEADFRAMNRALLTSSSCLSLLSTVALALGACGSDGPSTGATLDIGATDTAVADGAGSDTVPSDTEQLACGAPREAIATRTDPIVGGTGTWTPAVLPLTAAQALAVGGVLVDSGGWGLEILCTATLVAPNVVLTAAHCIVTSPHSELSAAEVAFGVGADLASPRHVFPASAVYVHPDYDYWASDASHDVAILVLEEDATAVLGAEIAPVPVHCAALASAGFVGEPIQVVGYGALDKWGEEYGTERQWAVETIVALSSLDFTVDGGGVQGVCYGDSGGPAMVVRDGAIRVVGVLSWGDELCGYEDHFVRTDHECAFISPHLPACGAVTDGGSCVGATATYCASGSVVSDDCGARGEVCALDATGRARCAAAPDPCAGESAAGRCDGAVAVYCASNAVVREDCGARGERCAADAAGAMRCAPDPCAGETFAGRCDGTDAVWCEAGAVRRRPCGDCQQSCGFLAAVGGVDCLPL